MSKEKALVVFSGGQDSTTSLYWARNKFEEVHAITFDYCQRHRAEIYAAEEIVRRAGMVGRHEIVKLGPILKGRSPLINANEDLERYRDYAEMDKIIGDRVELTFVPMRNALFLTVAANRAIVLGARHLVTGVCQQDNANYPDCRDVFIAAQEDTINRAIGRDPAGDNRFTIHTPLMHMSKAQSVRFAMTIPGAYEALAWSHTAYDGSYPPKGDDHASVLRAQGFFEAGIPDPLIMRAWHEGLITLPGTANYDAPRGKEAEERALAAGASII